MRLLPPLARGHRAACASSASTRTASRSPGRACFPTGRGRVNAAGPRLLRPARRRAARGRHRAVRDALPLGPAAGARGRRRLARARDGRGVRRVRRGRRRAARRPRAALDDAQRAVRAPRGSATSRRARARPDDRRRGRGRAPTTSCSRTACAVAALRRELPGARGRDRARPRGRVIRPPTTRADAAAACEADGFRNRLVLRPGAARRATRTTCSSGSAPTRRRSATATSRRSRRRSTSSASTTTRARRPRRPGRTERSWSVPPSDAPTTAMGWEVYPDGALRGPDAPPPRVRRRRRST